MAATGHATIATIGLPAREVSVLKYLLRMASTPTLEYALAEPGHVPDILIVDGDDPQAVSEWRKLCSSDPSKRALPTMMVSKEDTACEPPLYALKRPVVPSRVNSTLEQMARHFQATAPAAVTLRHKALVVDDSPTTRKQVEIELEQLGIAAVLAESAEEAFAILDKGEAYDLIFLDVIMPGADGYNVCKTIKRNKQRKRTPVIMLTSKGSPFDRVRGKLAGCNTYLTKPVGRERFQTTVKKYLG